MKVSLYTRDGAFVSDAKIPPFDPAPEVILFGSRTFVRQVTSFREADGDLSYKYVEGLLVAIDPRES